MVFQCPNLVSKTSMVFRCPTNPSRFADTRIKWYGSVPGSRQNPVSRWNEDMTTDLIQTRRRHTTLPGIVHYHRGRHFIIRFGGVWWRAAAGGIFHAGTALNTLLETICHRCRPGKSQLSKSESSFGMENWRATSVCTGFFGSGFWSTFAW